MVQFYDRLARLRAESDLVRTDVESRLTIAGQLHDFEVTFVATRHRFADRILWSLSEYCL